MYKKILVAFDGSEGAKKALNSTLSIGKALKSEIIALWVGGYRAYYHETVAEIEEESKAIINFSEKLKKELNSISKKEEIEIKFAYLQGNPAKLIAQFAEKNEIDLIVLGCKGHSGLWGNLLGHTPDKISENAHCSVLIVREK